MSKAESFSGSLEFTGKAVLLKKKGAGTKTIPLTAITGVEFKKAGLMSGYVRLTLPGGEGTARKVRNKNEEILRDPNSILFNFNKNSEFEAVADEITSALYS